METFKLQNGYSNRIDKRTFRRMTIEEGKRLYKGQRVCFDHGGLYRRAKVNGAVKTWKKDTKRVEVPLKYGLYDCFIACNREDGTMEYLLVEVTE